VNKRISGENGRGKDQEEDGSESHEEAPFRQYYH
jgi:hypothetical protein